jgi:Flp pilus assembly protein TadG
MIFGRTRFNGSKGQALVEFALILPILLILLLGVLDFGRAVAAYNSVSNAARSAARVAIVNQDPAVVEAAARDSAVGFSPLDVVFAQTPTPPAVCVLTACSVAVTVSYEYVPATPIFSNLVGTITVSSTTEMPVEHVAPAP